MMPSWHFPLMTIHLHRIHLRVPSRLNLVNRKELRPPKAPLPILPHCSNRFCKVLTLLKILRLLPLVVLLLPVVVAVLAASPERVVMVALSLSIELVMPR
ncbi:hypothetical protein AO724_07220 [Aeromonas allosaccharophila]|nr:hypothetical protein AO724_07220 [Aeromonas allosaccharophila]